MADASARNFSHLDDRGSAAMIDVSGKAVTRRVAEASCRFVCAPETILKLAKLPKGDALAAARIAGIQAAKRTSDWIPLAHPLPLDEVAVEFSSAGDHLLVRSRVVATARTGAEMEALVACAAAALCLYDMVKAIDRSSQVTDLRLEAKSGGRSGDYRRRGDAPLNKPLPRVSRKRKK